ncbi:hypothetical protein [Methanoregula sp.]|uniref:hypothetical protein n=1 Tax=Methanoregula sp. TaxID=2052170 RepID=UPI00356952A3
MHSHTHGGGRRSPDIPWLLVATVVGIIVVVIVALFFFAGLGGSSAGHTSSATATVKPTTSAASASTTSASKTSSIVIATTTPVTVPATGIYVKVDYLGGFSGTYTTNGATTKVTNSGTRLYEVANATDSITAAFQKSDSTASHALTVGIYKDGNQLASNSTSAAYGKVTVTASV